MKKENIKFIFLCVVVFGTAFIVFSLIVPILMVILAYIMGLGIILFILGVMYIADKIFG